MYVYITYVDIILFIAYYFFDIIYYIFLICVRDYILLIFD